MPLVVRPCSCSSLTTVHIGALEEGFQSNSFSLPLHASASLAANRNCLESRNTGVGGSHDSLISAPCGVVGSAPRMDRTCRLMRSWRSSRLPTSLGSLQSSLSYNAIAWTHATWMAYTLSGTTPYVFVRVRSLASPTLAFFMHRLCWSLNVRCVSNQAPSHCVAWFLNRTTRPRTLILAVSFGRRYFLWPCLCVNSAVSVFAVLNFSSPQLAHSMLLVAHLLSIVTT